MQCFRTAGKTAAIFFFSSADNKGSTAFTKHTNSVAKALEPAIKVIAAKPFTHPALCRYLDARKISFETAEKHCKEVEFELYDKRYFAIGLRITQEDLNYEMNFLKAAVHPKILSY